MRGRAFDSINKGTEFNFQLENHELAECSAQQKTETYLKYVFLKEDNSQKLLKQLRGRVLSTNLRATEKGTEKKIIATNIKALQNMTQPSSLYM